MRRSLAVLLAVVAAAFGTLVAVPASADIVQCDRSMPPDVYQACLQLQQTQLQQQQNGLAQQRIQNEIANIQQRMVENQRLIQSLLNQIAAQQAQVDATKAAIAKLDHDIKLKQADIDRENAHLNVREQLLGRRVRATALHGGINYVELIVTSTSFTQLIDRVMITQQLIRSDQQLLQELKDERAKVQAAQDQLAAERRHQNDLLGVQQAQQDALQASQNQLQADQAYEAQLEQQAQQQLAMLEQQRQVIDSQVAADQAAYDAAAAAAGGGTGVFSWPQHYGTFYVTQGFGCTPYTFEPYDPNCPSKHFHTGLDIAGPDGNPVYAADTGIVHLYESKDSGGHYWGYGMYIVMIHGNGYSSLYGHLGGFAVSDGATVGRGTLIGYEGSTGWSTGPHTHFEIRVNNVAQNPCTYLNPTC